MTTKIEKNAEKNYDILATKMRMEDAAAFRRLAEREGKPVSRMLSDMAKAALKMEKTREENPTGTNTAVLTYENVDRLKHEVAFHNPDHLNPDRMLNHILNMYFAMAEEIRRTTK